MQKKHSKFSLIILIAVLLVTGLPLSYQIVSASKKTNTTNETEAVQTVAKKVVPTETSTKIPSVLTNKKPFKKPISLAEIVIPTTILTTTSTPANPNSNSNPTNPNTGSTPETFVPQNANFLLNPNFEEGLSNWTVSNELSLDTNTQGNSGANSIHYVPNQSDMPAHLLSEKFIIDSALHYKWSQYLAIQGSTDLNFYIDEYDANDNWISGQWKGKATSAFTGTKSLTYIPTSNTVRFVRLQYSITPGTTAELYLDSIYFESTNYYD